MLIFVIAAYYMLHNIFRKMSPFLYPVGLTMLIQIINKHVKGSDMEGMIGYWWRIENQNPLQKSVNLQEN